MTIKNLYPKSRPATIYNVINGRPELPGSNRFTRDSVATYVDRTGTIQAAAIDEPRFNHDPDTGEFLGLLLEDSSTQIIYSSKLYTSIWSVQTPEGATDNAGIAPDGSNTAFNTSVAGAGQRNYTVSGSSGNYAYSIYVKSTGGQGKIYRSLNGFNGTDQDGSSGLIYDFGTDVVDHGYSRDLYPNGWVRLWKVYKRGSSSTFLARTSGDNDLDILYWGAQLEEGSVPTSLIINPGTTSITRSPDAFSLTTSSNFDNGFSLLLDSETTTEDFIYKIKNDEEDTNEPDDKKVIASLTNDNGTLKWDVNGISAQSEGLYPQVGFTTGRVRTVSSFGAADSGVQQNYLYTTGLSFPTPAEVASGADELEFGVPQTLKAVYVWNGQLASAEAISVIKGDPSSDVNNIPVVGDPYSFVYNTDPTDIGETSISLKYIVPVESMRIYWGDGNTDRLEKAADGTLPLPQHTYPYPGQYRIQIVSGDNLFDSVRLGDVADVITRVDQWAPQHRVGASGLGFTGDDMVQLLDYQSTLDYIPPFKYTDITDLTQTFYITPKLRVNNWDWVPYELESCTTLTNTFYNCTKDAPDYSDAGRLSFPQLQTSSALTNVAQIWANSSVKGWKDKDGNLTNQPFTDSSQVTNWLNAFANNGILSLGVNTQSATTLEGAFAGNSWTTSPFFNAPNCTNFKSIFLRCKQMTTMNPSIANSTYSNGTDFTSAWQDCEVLTSFPEIVTSKGTNFSNTWQGCESLTSFPTIDTSSGTNFSNAWDGCTGLTSFPNLNFNSATKLQGTWQSNGLTAFPRLDFPLVNQVNSAWRSCTSLASFPTNTTFPVCTSFTSAWRGCNSFTSFPPLDLLSGTGFSSTWRGCTNLTSFPKLNVSSGVSFGNAWGGCTKLADFPDDNSQDMFNTTGVLNSTAFDEAFTGCALTKESIENILVSLDANGQSNIELGIDGGTNAAKSTWTAAAVAAYDNLIAKGWTISFNA
jgi:hypothetical protein